MSLIARKRRSSPCANPATLFYSRSLRDSEEPAERLVRSLPAGGIDGPRVGVGESSLPGGPPAADPEPAVTKLTHQQARAAIPVGDGDGAGGTPAALRFGDGRLGPVIVEKLVR